MREKGNKTTFIYDLILIYSVAIERVIELDSEKSVSKPTINIFKPINKS